MKREGEVSLEWKIPEYYHPDSPFHSVNLPSEDVTRNIANRSKVVKGTSELWGEDSTYEELEAVIKDYPNERKLPYLASGSTFRIIVDSFGKVMSFQEQNERIQELILGFNSVGFYQMTKLAIIPCTVLLETLFFRKKFSRTIQLSLCVLLLGVGIATVTDLQLNALGSVLSLLAVMTTCIAQIMTNTIQKRFKVSSTQLLYQSCPYQAMTLFIISPFLDGLLTNENVFAFKYTPQVLVFIILSCLISVSVNFSTFLVIGKTSPVTYQVLRHLKTCLVLAFGYVLLHDPFNWRNIAGILVALGGMLLYSFTFVFERVNKNL
ncbi:hypothetical protein GIB67_002381 [Kingdonia uniflora]|uniref:Sugar phosphate transporter domain-containing protein n=1 Tax=Kingdonia uniflora TaxID=39325 RepID=A0A7J7M8C6_9MAGN|nr:hypothetical protein GIB67_002381 [Kingdonia uniflora]